jgi:16S rRNA (adenine1518-N6/adenine1519-N6)-dimethyltransferase
MEPRHNTDLGQHFLREPRIARRIIEAADVEPGMRVLEIGPGGGVLTGPLTEAVGPTGRVIAIEADKRFAKRLKFDNLDVVVADALKINIADHGPFDRIVANLPYQISGPIIAAFLDLHREQGWGRAVLMLQKEFADRLLAGPGTKKFGRLSVHTARVGTVAKVRDVPPGCFEPPPKVMSTVIKINPYEDVPFVVENEPLWTAVVDGSFQQRRKQLKNTVPPVVAGFGVSSETAIAALEAEELTMERPEQVSPERFAALVERMSKVAG